MWLGGGGIVTCSIPSTHHTPTDTNRYTDILTSTDFPFRHPHTPRSSDWFLSSYSCVLLMRLTLASYTRVLLRYPIDFTDEYLNLVCSAADGDREGLLESSIKLGFLTGTESSEMIHAHIEAGMIIGEPFATDEPYVRIR